MCKFQEEVCSKFGNSINCNKDLKYNVLYLYQLIKSTLKTYYTHIHEHIVLSINVSRVVLVENFSFKCK